MKTDPKITVITPAFNRVGLIGQTVESVLSQDLHEIEYIIVDDGSSDGTFELLKDISDYRVRVYSHPDHGNLGQAASINLGLREARGQYIVILDSDDLLAPGALKVHSRLLDNDSTLGMVYGQGFAIDASGKDIYRLFPDDHREENDPNRLLLDCYIVSPGLCMFRKNLVDKVGPLEAKFRAAQDHDFVLRIAEAAKISYSPKVCFYYRKHDGTISAKGQFTRWTNGFEILRRAKSRYSYRPEIIRKRRAVLNYRLGKMFLGSGEFLKGARHLVLAGIYDPMRAVKELQKHKKA